MNWPSTDEKPHANKLHLSRMFELRRECPGEHWRTMIGIGQGVQRNRSLPHMTLWAAMRSIRSAISLPSIDPPQAHENSASSSLESSKNRCASPTLPLLKPAAYRTLSCAASANGEPGCERYFHSPASRYSRDVNYDPWCPGAGGCQFSVTRRRLSGNQLRSSQFPWG